MGATTVTLRTGDAWNTRGNRRSIMASVAGSSSYATGGDTVTAANFGLVQIDDVAIMEQPAGYAVEYDRTNLKFKFYRSGAFTVTGTISTPTFTGTANAGTAGIVNDADTAATLGHALYVVRNSTGFTSPLVLEGGTGTGIIDDDDTAATLGVQLYVVLDEEEFLPGFALGHFEFVSPTNAHGTCTVFNGGPTLLIEDDDLAATNGVAVRAIAADGGLEATIAGSGRTILVALSNGKYIGVADSTTGSTPEVYFDEDSANTYERLVAVVVDNGNETFELYQGAAVTGRPGVFDSSRLASLVTVGPGDSVSVGTVGSAGGGPEYDVVHDQAAASLVGAALLYVQAAGAGFNAAVPGGEDVYIPVANGEFIKVAYAASPAGVQVYWDHDGTNNWERMTAVVVDNLDETYSTEAAVGWRRDTPVGTVSAPTFTGDAVSQVALAQVTSTTNLSAVTFDVEAIGY